MSSNHTQNYHLSQWQKTDRVLMSEFNQDNEKIDTALSQLAAQVSQKADSTRVEAVSATIPKFISGTYTGNGEITRIIPLPFQPKAVFLTDHRGVTCLENGHSFHYGGLALTNLPVYTTETVDHRTAKVLEIAGSGFTVSYIQMRSENFQIVSASNQDAQIYHYIAFA